MPVRQVARTVALAAEVRSKGPLNGVVAMGTEMYNLESVVPREIPCATYDDGTLAQMWSHPDSDIRNSGFPERHVQKWIARQAASSRRADRCCVSTSWAAESFVANYGVARERVRVIGMGHRPRKIPLRERNWSSPRFLFVGVDWKRKNGEMVLRAFREVRAKIPDAVLSLVGESPQMEESGIERYGFLPREDLAAQRILDGLYDNATCFVLPSRFDPSAIAYLEASSAGLPVIATGAGGSSELLGDAAVIVNPDDVDGIARAMLDLSDPDRAREAGVSAAARAAQYSWERVGQRLLDVLTDLEERP
jgi:glycosyltransferase involved in cell wall biosynthesis